MKRFHVHLSVSDLGESIRFYSKLFGEAPRRVESDYAKWMLEDPKINFAVSTRHQPLGVNHFGLQVESAEELSGMQAQLHAADDRMVTEAGQACCYARSDKYWVTDPTRIAWESFHTLESISLYGSDTPVFDHGASTTPVLVEIESSGRTRCRATARSAPTGECCS